ncbi:transposase [Streptomyces sp. NPDC001744]|uniref:transposase n=1 Tax=Streptomyces sp. NPDC001744 TaxID=3364606 RepID=UPI00368D13A7
MSLSDVRRSRIETLLPSRTPGRGRWRWRGHREVIDAIAWKSQTGSRWVHLPEKCGNRQGANVGRSTSRCCSPGWRRGEAHAFDVMVAPPRQFPSGVSRPVSR